MKKRITLGHDRAIWSDLRPGDIIVDLPSNLPGTWRTIVVEREVPVEVPDLPGWRELDLVREIVPRTCISVQIEGQDVRWFAPE